MGANTQTTTAHTTTVSKDGLTVLFNHVDSIAETYPQDDKVGRQLSEIGDCFYELHKDLPEGGSGRLMLVMVPEEATP